jgi:hypothetical protein
MCIQIRVKEIAVRQTTLESSDGLLTVRLGFVLNQKPQKEQNRNPELRNISNNVTGCCCPPKQLQEI